MILIVTSSDVIVIPLMSLINITNSLFHFRLKFFVWFF